ncbi:STM4015 family protein [Streptomyces sp. NPDC002793]|uniref:STM4015 family protein n=1 Tax=Streptomyces sp. NPDC002793 TaxID=3154432 RepID=UPI003330F5A7
MHVIDHVEHLHGLPAHTFPQFTRSKDMPAADAVAWRIELGDMDGEEGSDDYWERFLSTMPAEDVRALIIGYPWYTEWGMGSMTGTLAEASSRLVGLEALFLGDIVAEQSELSWMEQSDVTPVLTAYPRLRELAVRGSAGLEFTAVRHEALRTLRFECGGLPAGVVRGVLDSDLPALEHLELWLGDEYYGCDTTLEDLAPLLEGARFPALRHLGLQNSQFQDEIAAAVAHAPVVARLESLSLSLGTLGDAGAEALLNGQPLTHLRSLDLHHHFLSDAMTARIRETLEPAGVRVDLSGREEEDEYDDDDEGDGRYIAAAE